MSIDNEGYSVHILNFLMPTNKPRLVLYMNPDKLAELQEWAKEERRSPSNLAIYLIEKALEKRQKKPKEESE